MRFLKGEKIENPNIPASFSLLINELKSLALDIELKEGSRESRELGKEKVKNK